MTTAQIILFYSLLIMFIISFIVSSKTDNRERKIVYNVLWLMVTLILFFSAFISTHRLNELNHEKNKCPEYQKIENVYILKK